MLTHLLSGLIKSVKGSPCKQKVLSVAYSIISSVRPRSFVSAVQVGIEVFLHRGFRSRHLINLLHSLSWSISYSEICQYETFVTMNTSREVQDNGYVQFVFDNANHNTRNVDGHGIFHVMGGVQCVTPSSAVQTTSCIPRPNIRTTEKVVGNFGFILIVTYDGLKNHGLNRLVMEYVLSLRYQVFAKNAVVHMASGHTYARELRAYSLSQAAIAHLTVEYCEEDRFLIDSDSIGWLIRLFNRF
ncbi:hypothetical protein AVEN_146773-1 [Araneus ventricosus]|uniref:Uncharacterized protein n=1 Tax=Araneus ventricosus TaxID=182803 RepID=A0A4Y2D786_ARAVE|nr:hypothetical protein AVEN_146773-1 [Araneus ventricosus]